MFFDVFMYSVLQELNHPAIAFVLDDIVVYVGENDSHEGLIHFKFEYKR